jgi:hypothetical protein
MIRHGWRYGAEDFVARLVDRIGKPASENHRAKERVETDKQRAERIVRAGLTKLGWRDENLRLHRKSHPHNSSAGKSAARSACCQFKMDCTPLA